MASMIFDEFVMEEAREIHRQVMADLREAEDERYDDGFWEQRHREQKESEEADPVDLEMNIARSMLGNVTHHRALIAQVRTLVEIRRELDHDDPRKAEIYTLIGRINAKLAQSKLDTANELIAGIQHDFTQIGKLLDEGDLEVVQAWLTGSSLALRRGELFQARPWLVRAIEEVTRAPYGDALESFNVVFAAAKSKLARLQEAEKAINQGILLKAVELQRQKVRDAALQRMDKELVAKCRAELSRIKAAINSGNVDAASSMLVKYRINIKERDLILAVEGIVPEEFFRQIDAAIRQKRQERR